MWSDFLAAVISCLSLLRSAVVLSVTSMGTTFFALGAPLLVHITNTTGWNVRKWKNVFKPGVGGLIFKYWLVVIVGCAVVLIYRDHKSARDKLQKISTQNRQLLHPDGPKNWSDMVNIEHAFLMVPRPCKVKIKPLAKEAKNDRNILAYILRTNMACEVLDDEADSHAVWLDHEDVDIQAPDSTVGLVIRWDERVLYAEDGMHFLKGCCMKVHTGHVMPPNIPPDVIFIEVGSDPWGPFP